MSEATIFKAINTQMATLPNIDENNTAWLGVAYVPQAETPYLDLSMPAITAKMITVGKAGVLEWRGIYQVTCNWPIGGGIDDVLVQRDAVRALFPNGLSLLTDDGWYVKFFAADPKPLIQDGGWLRGIIQVPWLLHEVTL